MKRIVIHSRVSTKDQKVENQIRECKLYASEIFEEGDEIVYFEEPDTSSTIAAEKREQLQRMIKFIKRGDVLIVYKLDRLARDGQELINIYGDLVGRGVKVHSIYEPAADLKYVHIIAFVAMTERENVSLRTISALKRKRADGERVGTTEYGYRLDQTKLSTYENSHSQGKPYLLLEDPEEKQNIALMKTYFQEGLSYRRIAAILKAQGVVNRKGNPFHLSMIHKLIHRKAQTTPQELALV